MSMPKQTRLNLERLEGREVPATISLNAARMFISKQTRAPTITATATQRNIIVTAANTVQLSSSQDDTFGGEVIFTPGFDNTAVTMQEGAVGGTNNITIDGNLRIITAGAADTIFLRGMNLNGDL